METEKNEEKQAFEPDKEKFDGIVQEIVNSVEGEYDVVNDLSKLVTMYFQLAHGYEVLAEAVFDIGGIVAGATKNVKL